jgi:D-glycero-alpha-D-manno-heptose 1-phosphate guanylyltransferase
MIPTSESPRVRLASGTVHVVLLAGGAGSRVAHLLHDTPKPLAPVAGRPFIEWVIRFFGFQGFRKFVLATGYQAYQLERYVASRPFSGLEIACRKETFPQGTGGAFLNAIAESSAPSGGWIVGNADSLLLTDLGGFVASAADHKRDAAILGLEVSDASRYGSLSLDPSGCLRSFDEKSSRSGLINAGIYWLSPSCARMFPPKRPLSFEREVFPAMLSRGARIEVTAVRAPFIDIGTPESLAQAEGFVASYLKPVLEPAAESR